MPSSTARTLKGPRRLVRRSARRGTSPHWQFLRGFLKHPVMVGSIIPSSRVLIEKMLKPVDWENTRVFVEYGPGVGTFTRPILEHLGPDATLVTIDTNADFTRYLRESIDDPRLVPVTGRLRTSRNPRGPRPGPRGLCPVGPGFSHPAGGGRRRDPTRDFHVDPSGGAFLLYNSPQGSRIHRPALSFQSTAGFKGINVPSAHFFWAGKKNGKTTE